LVMVFRIARQSRECWAENRNKAEHADQSASNFHLDIPGFRVISTAAARLVHLTPSHRRRLALIA
jgi:hypothetical protein